MISLLGTFMRYIARTASYTLIILGLTIAVLLPSIAGEGSRTSNILHYYTVVYAYEPPIVEEQQPSIVERPICTGLYCYCVTYIRENRGVDIRGDAKDMEPNYFGAPQKGDVALFRYSTGSSHVAFIEAILPSGNFYVSEANFIPGEYGERVVMIDDPYLVGFIRK
jgi:hypothetical protein